MITNFEKWKDDFIKNLQNLAEYVNGIIKELQYMTGRNNWMDYLITTNRKDYKDVSLSVLTPAEWLGVNGIIKELHKLEMLKEALEIID